MIEPDAYLDIGTEVNLKDSFWKIECSNLWYGAEGFPDHLQDWRQEVS